MHLTAQITNISRTSVHDGPGVRTVVYFKGCALQCRWCHNPETIGFRQEVIYTPVKCIFCGRCITICPQCHRREGDLLRLEREHCVLCGKCVEQCPSGALSLSATEKTVEEVMAQIQKDMRYYRQSGGGVTLSGGECLLQADFCAALLKGCKDAGIHTMIETALFVPWHNVQKVMPWCDGFFADFKIPDPAKHKAYTGQDNELILRNLQMLASQRPGQVTVRIPLIPGVNDGSEDIAGFAAALLSIAPLLAGIEVLRYNGLASSKYAQLGKPYTDFGQPQNDEALLCYCRALQQALEEKAEVYTVL